MYFQDSQDFQDFSRFLQDSEISQDFSRILKFLKIPRIQGCGVTKQKSFSRAHHEAEVAPSPLFVLRPAVALSTFVWIFQGLGPRAPRARAQQERAARVSGSRAARTPRAARHKSWDLGNLGDLGNLQKS